MLEVGHHQSSESFRSSVHAEPSRGHLGGRTAAPQTLEARWNTAAIRRLSAKDHLFTEGDQQTHVYKIEAGTVLIYKILPDAKRQVISIAFAGDLVGLGTMGEHAYNAQATEPTRVRCLSVGELHQLACEDSRLALKLYEAVAEELSAARNLVLTIGYRDASERLATFLRAIAQRTRKCEDGSSKLVLPLRRCDIADFLGLTIETVSRTMTRFKAAGLIDLDHGGYVEILDPVRLGAIADGAKPH